MPCLRRRAALSPGPVLLALPALQYEVMVTAGANQAFVNLVLTLCDASDKVVLFKPYYFNHM